MKNIFSQAELSTAHYTVNGRIVLVGGCFDVLHRGHVEFLQEAKKLGDVLFVLLESDETIKKRKGENRPIHTQEDRAQILAGLRAVDRVIMLRSNLIDSDYSKLVNSIKPDIIAITEGDPIKEKKAKQATSVGGQLFTIEKKGNYSTNGIIKKIKEL
jgi:rfaE bifunctional protein nucleotidyltransferase chain/domain